MIWYVVSWTLGGVILACLVLAIVTDLGTRIIPNRLVLIVLCCSVVLRAIAGPGPLLASLLTALVVLIALGVLATYDLMGWGDVKLITAVTFAVPADRVIALLLAITLAGGVLGCLYLAMHYNLRRGMSASPDVEPHNGRATVLRRLARRESLRILANEPMPYAVAVFGGVVFGLATD